MVSKPLRCGQNYHLASDRLVIIGARRWKGEKKEEGRGGELGVGGAKLVSKDLYF